MSNLILTSRRKFITHGLGIMGVGAVAPNYLVQTALAGPQAQPDQRIMVLLQLAGGHDALSALVPYGHEEYGQLRQATRIHDKEVLKLNNELGLHPSLTGFREMHEQGTFAAIPGVGYAEPNYSHFTATDIWFTSDLNPSVALTGWLGRACDQAYKGNPDPKLSIAVGTSKTPRVLSGVDHPGLSFSSPESYRYTGDRGEEKRKEAFRKLNQPGRGGLMSNMDFIAQTAGNANASSDLIRKLGAEYKPKVEYPKTRLGANMRTIAAMIMGGLSTRIYYTDQGGFDTHSRQRPGHDKLMTELNDAVSAFYKDLKAQGQAERVLTFTASEFGRRVKENGSEGTDHGAASAMFMFGPVKAGVHGQHPSLTDLQGGAGGSLKHTTDFRSVYATLLEKWIGTQSEPVIGGKFPLIDCLG